MILPYDLDGVTKSGFRAVPTRYSRPEGRVGSEGNEAIRDTKDFAAQSTACEIGTLGYAFMKSISYSYAIPKPHACPYITPLQKKKKKGGMKPCSILHDEDSLHVIDIQMSFRSYDTLTLPGIPNTLFVALLRGVVPLSE